jgi:stage II sporulation protein D
VFSCDTSFQVYGGLAGEHPRVSAVLRDTCGEALTYGDRLFPSYFHSTCGGQTARASLVFGEPPIPPLEGARCGGCDGTRYSRWESEVDAASVEKAIRLRIEQRSAPIDMGRLLALEVAETGPDGRVSYVRIEHERGSFEWRADRLRLQMAQVVPGAIRSTAFAVESKPDGSSFVFRGSGWGHGVGLCQVGCRRLAEKWTYREILAHYYPSSQLETVY